MKKPIQGLAEAIFETFLFNSRIIVIIAVVGSLVSSVLMFLHGALQIYQATTLFVQHPMPQHDAPAHADLSVLLISSVDTFLFATVLLRHGQLRAVHQQDRSCEPHAGVATELAFDSQPR